MRKEYDLKRLDWKRNPYARRLKKVITIRLDQDLVDYFKGLGRETGIVNSPTRPLPYRRIWPSAMRKPTKWIPLEGAIMNRFPERACSTS